MARVLFHSAACNPAQPPVHPLVAACTLEALRRESADEVPPGGPGWFDSSWDLARGLDVQEGLPQDASLNEWLDVCLRTGCPDQRSRSRATASPSSITAMA